MFFVFDIDGTIVSKKDKIPKKNVKAIKKLIESGHNVILATGREINSTNKIANKLDLHLNNSYCVSYNGAVLWKFNDKKIDILYKNIINYDDAKKIFDKAIEINVNIIGYSDHNNLVCSDMNSLNAKFLSKRNNQSCVKYDNEFDGNIYKFVVFGKSKKISILKEWLSENDFSFFAFSYIPGTENIEICAKETDKRNALMEISKIEKCSNEDFYYFGDGENDEKSIIWVKNSVAMKNAPTKIKDIAMFKTDKINKKSGVGDYIYKYILK